jgi:glycerol-3-phosphate dehydrogenase subunit B
MIFDTVIIGGGLSGLTCGIKLQEAGMKCVIISSGQSALHFSSGSFDLLNTLPDGTTVVSPAESLPSLIQLNPLHPYAKIGEKNFTALAAEAKQLLQRAGIVTTGDFNKNSYRITPLAMTKATWLTMNDYISFDDRSSLQWKKIALFSIKGYLDFYPQFFVNKFRKWNLDVHETEIDLKDVERRKRNPSELRSTNIARIFDEEEAINNLINILKRESDDCDVILLPACLGLEKTDVIKEISSAAGKPVKILATFPPSVAGIRSQYLLKQKFMDLGGIYMLGDTVNHVDIINDNITSAFTANHGNIPIRGDEFVICSGSFFSQGLIALPDKVIDPICGLDVSYLSNRQEWYTADVFDKQNYQSFGIITDENFHGIKDDKIINNLHVCGASLGGFDAMKEGCGGGVSLLTALFTANDILSKRTK